jgi:hypothetical protein
MHVNKRNVSPESEKERREERKLNIECNNCWWLPLLLFGTGHDARDGSTKQPAPNRETFERFQAEKQ